jgi:VWFA-related protein
VCFANPGNYTTVSRNKYTLPKRKRQTVQSAQNQDIMRPQRFRNTAMRVGWRLAFAALLLVNSNFLIAQRTTGGRSAPNRSPVRSSAPSSSPTSDAPFATRATTHHADEEARVEFRSETVLVQVPAVVTNKSGEHVRGLSRSDFRVFENGKEQKIQSFEEVEPTRVPLHAPAEWRIQQSGRNFARFASDPGQAISLVAITGSGLKVLHGLTSDPSALTQALKKVNGELPALQGVDIDVEAAVAVSDSLAPTADFVLGASSPQAVANDESALQDFVLRGDVAIAGMQQDRAIEITMRAFLNIAASLSGVSGRKSLIWATGGFPFRIDSPAAVPGGYLSVLYERAMESLNDAEIAVYPVDVRSLMNYSPTADVTYSPRNVSGPAFARSLAARSWLQNSKIDTLHDSAEMTGGRAFYNTNDLVSSFKRTTDDSSSYYLLGYYLDTKNDKPGWRQLKMASLCTAFHRLFKERLVLTRWQTSRPEGSRTIIILICLSGSIPSAS